MNPKRMQLVSMPDEKSRQEQEIEIALALREKARIEHEPFRRCEIPQSTGRTADDVLNNSFYRVRVKP